MKKLFRKIKKKLSPLLAIPIVFLALLVTGGYFLFFSGDDGKNGSENASNTPPPAPVPDGPDKTPTTPAPPQVKPDPAAGKEFTIDSDRDEKDYAIAQAIGTITRPQTISLRIGAAPKQPVTVNWSVVCLLPSEGARSTDDTFTVTPPATRALKLPVNDAVSCNASAAAQLTRAGKGRIKVFLVGVRRAE